MCASGEEGKGEVQVVFVKHPFVILEYVLEASNMAS